MYMFLLEFLIVIGILNATFDHFWVKTFIKTTKIISIISRNIDGPIHYAGASD